MHIYPIDDASDDGAVVLKSYKYLNSQFADTPRRVLPNAVNGLQPCRLATTRALVPARTNGVLSSIPFAHPERQLYGIFSERALNSRLEFVRLMAFLR